MNINSIHSSSPNVLTHPAFDRPPVENKRRGRRPKSIPSLLDARFARDERRRQAEHEAAAKADAQPPALVPGADSGAKDSSAAPPIAAHEQAVIEAGLKIIEAHMRCARSDSFDSPQMVRDYLRLRFGALEYEAFTVLFLDAQHRLIAAEEMFRGTLTQTAVYPREIVKRALVHNAGAVILAHNHPSGVAEPSQADRRLTDSLKGTLALIDVRVLDHFIVAGDSALSFAQRGLI